jgi:hypothetical protein
MVLKHNFRFLVVFPKSRARLIVIFTDGLMIEKKSSILGEFSFWSTTLVQTNNDSFNSCKEIYGKQ